MCITNNAMFLACSAQVGSLIVRVVVLLMNPSIEESFDLMSTASVYDGTSGYESGRFFPPGSKCL